ncbi:intermediate filament protein-like protein [Lophium mytilinum]|uniref:Intermediate filament protein-like protein n=1 Tax=Lophium mytilinum TaxID=390894 RepID=A0A6A6QYP7_9PEZI|nr:intermediate filament protein-like protein [Lophium mytilinum]
MALRRRDVIIAAIVAFIAWGFVTHWIPTLRYLPYAFCAGVASTAALLLWFTLTTSRDLQHWKNGETLYGSRTVAFVAPGLWTAETEALTKRTLYEKERLYPQSTIISDNIDGLIDLILRDFVQTWYGKISPRATFTNEVDRAVRAALVDIRDRMFAVDMVEVVVSRMVPLITGHMKDFYEAERVVRGKRLTRSLTESEEVDLAIAAKYKDGKLHSAASLASSNTKLVQQQYLRSIVTRLIPKVLPPAMTTSSAVLVLIKEIVACAVLFPVMQMLSDPDTWNQLMEAYGRSVLQDRKTVRKLRAALDEHAPPSPKNPKNVQFPKLSPNDNERKFERFIRAIRQTNTLADARRFRSEVAGQLRRESAVEEQDSMYLRRLETAKRILDQKVTTLGAGGSVKGKLSIQPPQLGHRRTASKFEKASLRDILYDATGLSCFMEYMDRLNLMRLVQFWIVVDGFRNPLEQGTDEPEDYFGSQATWTDSDRADLAQINDAYLTKPELKVTPQARQAVKDFLAAGKTATPLQYQVARRAILQAQTAVYEDMTEPHFRRFKKSDLYFKLLALDEASGPSPSSPTKANTSVPDATRAPIIPPAKMARAQTSRHALHVPDLRRAAVSSSDLKGYNKSLEAEPPLRRSLDGGRAPLFDDDYDSDPLARSTQSLESEPEHARPAGNDTKIVDAMQAALNDIMEDEPDKGSIFSEQGVSALNSPLDNESLKGSIELPRPTSPMPSMSKKEREKKSIASLGLVGEPSRLGVFTEDDLFGDEEKFLEDEVEDPDTAQKTDDEEIHEAAPGDLGLAEAIDALTADIERLVAQDSIVDSLTTKAELTNNAAELRILRKSKASLQREIHRKELQRQQYIVQESDNSLYGRATVFIQSIMVGNEEDGREYAMYVIEVRRRAGDQMPAAVWVVTRRYSEFHDLNKRLRAKYPQIRNLEFPRRQMVLKLQKDFLQKRRLGLERYLRELLLIPAICRSRELRAFLSQAAISPTDLNSSQSSDSRDFVTRIYNSVTDGMEEFLGNIPVLDQLSVAGQNLISAATSQLAQNGGTALPTSTLVGAGPDLPSTDAEAEAELRAFENRELEPFVKPICDLFLEAFELNRETNWLRGRAVVVVLHQLLGGTIERKVREHAKLFLAEDNVLKYLDLVKGTMWPAGKMREPATRTVADKARSRKEAGLVLATLVPELAGSVVGRANAQAASRRILATVNNQRLNTHLAFMLLDEVVQVMFPDVIMK